MKNLGVMQGRLIPDENSRIQSFPRQNWRLEFSLLESLGFGYLEWTLDHNELWKNPLLTVSGLREIHELCDIHKIQVKSVTADNLMQAPIHKKNSSPSTSIEECINFIGLLEEANIEILVWPLVDSGSLSSNYEFEKFIELMDPIKKFLSDKKIMIAFETDLPPEYNSKLLSKIQSSNIGINYDIGNTASYGFSASREFEILGNSILHVHVKDRLFRGPTVPLGDGDVDWQQTVNAIKSHFKGILILQAARKPDELQTIKEYINFCERIGL